MSPDSVAQVFLLAENRLLREALVRILSKKNDICVVGAAPFSPGALEKTVSSKPAIVILDSIGLALSEPRVVRLLQARIPGVRVVMVDMEADEHTFLRAVREGATGYVLKDASALELAATIRSVAAGEAVCPPCLSMALFRTVAGQAALPSRPKVRNQLGLSRRQQELVALLGEGMSNKEIAAQLNLSEQTVKNHVHRMLRKVGATDRLTIVERCQAVGFITGVAN